MKQTRMDSFMESLVNIAIGLAISTVANLVLLGMILGFPMSVAENVLISSVFTVISLIRSYTIRRLFNGKSVWSAIKARLPAPRLSAREVEELDLLFFRSAADLPFSFSEYQRMKALEARA